MTDHPTPTQTAGGCGSASDRNTKKIASTTLLKSSHFGTFIPV
eukprot:CAMPEP_0185724436 /NCGR_PEP_ID=MMETSP1171-20130828/920_1 /TAXON_ID=374046 /ORGANISM="Helicotheca tamensis, Strain CCMP826" /LENGTH=42 /DNA_ID= /DNA_START= /DNA_END= /DNA_ORIENTATION=